MSEVEDRDEFKRLNTAMVAGVDDRVGGFGAWRDCGEWPGSGSLSWLYVDPGFHRRGMTRKCPTSASETEAAWSIVTETPPVATASEAGAPKESLRSIMNVGAQTHLGHDLAPQ